jgi:hypothetical protein
MHILNTVTSIIDFRREFGLANQFIGYSPGGITINYKTFNLTVTITFHKYKQ